MSPLGSTLRAEGRGAMWHDPEDRLRKAIERFEDDDVETAWRMLRALERKGVSSPRIHLYLAGRELLVLGPRGALLNGTVDMDHGFGTQLAAGGMRLRVGGIELHLDDPAAITEIDEDEATQVAAAVHPAV